jgi:hypothetical protein
MIYRHLLEKLAKFGIGQVSRSTCGTYDVASIGCPNEVVFPFPFPHIDIILDNGLESEIDEEIVDSILRWAGKTREEFDPLN